MVSSFTSTAPFFTAPPDSKVISRMSPGSSEPRVTPRAATRVATACREATHSVCCTSAELTDSGGGTNEAPALIMVSICAAFTPPRTPRVRIKPMGIAIQSLVLVFMFPAPPLRMWLYERDGDYRPTERFARECVRGGREGM